MPNLPFGNAQNDRHNLDLQLSGALNSRCELALSACNFPVVGHSLVIGAGYPRVTPRALVVGKLDAVPGAAGGRALRIVVCDARITALPAR